MRDGIEKKREEKNKNKKRKNIKRKRGRERRQTELTRKSHLYGVGYLVQI
jgi:hypothetical protein